MFTSCPCRALFCCVTMTAGTSFFFITFQARHNFAKAATKAVVFHELPPPPPPFLSGTAVYQPATQNNFLRWTKNTLRIVQICFVFIPVLWSYFLFRFFHLANMPYVLDKLVDAIETLGPSFIKLAQWASTRPDIFGANFTIALRQMTIAAPRHTYSETLRILEKELGAHYTDLADVSPSVIGSGAVAQVHTATVVKTNQKVAVKVLHPRVRENFDRDLDVLAGVAWLLSSPRLARWIPSGSELYASVIEFSSFMRSQLDLTGEGAALLRFSANFRGVQSDVRFPQPLLQYNTPAVLVESLEPGTVMNEYLASGSLDHVDATTKHNLAVTGIKMFLKMIFVDNYVHGDLHPGNMLVAPDGHTLVILDPGLITTLSPDDRRNFLSLFAAVAAGDGKLGAKLMLEKSRGGKDVIYRIDKARYEADMDRIFSAVNGTESAKRTFQLADVKVGDVLTDVLDTVQRHGIRIESNFTTLIASIIVLEGVGRQLDPNLNIFASAAPFLLSEAVLDESEVAFLRKVIRKRYAVPKKTTYTGGKWYKWLTSDLLGKKDDVDVDEE